MADEDVPTKRESHFSQQRSSYRSSLRSDQSGLPPTRSRPQSRQRLEDFNLDLESKSPADRADSETLPSGPSSPAPNVPYTRSKPDSNAKRKGIRVHSSRAERRTTPDSARRLEAILGPDTHQNSYELIANASRPTTKENTNSAPPSRAQRSRHSSFLLGRLTPGSQLDITALPSIANAPEEMDTPNPYHRSKPTRSARRLSALLTELYTISYLIFFAIFGILARLGLQALTFYPGAPVSFSELWANVAGTFIMGFLAEDRRLFRAEWGRGESMPEPVDRSAEDAGKEKARHGKVKKTIPLYIGLATGFCGSFTSFSSFIRDVFLSSSNDLRSPINHPYPAGTPIPSPSTTIHRDRGYSALAVLATIIITLATCYSALKVGSHFALLVDPITPSLPFRFTRRVMDPLFLLLGWGCWIGAIILTIFPIHDAWRGQALFACVFAPVGCLLRYYISLSLNSILPTFPLGTFSVNIFGTAVLGMAYDLQHVDLRSTGVVGGSIITCQVLQGIMDGFCGALTTVSTWMLELDGLKRRHAYVYGGVSVGVGLGLLTAIMGGVRWSVGWQSITCIT
jgi:CrcB protein